MALRDQPYLPLYVQDFLTDEKLNECSAAATGVYIKLLCLMHKHEQYGKIVLREKEICHSKSDGKTDGKLYCFAMKLAKPLPFDQSTILAALTELLEEDVIQLEGNSLIQKRMVKDNELSIKRSRSGLNGAESKWQHGKK